MRHALRHIEPPSRPNADEPAVGALAALLVRSQPERMLEQFVEDLLARGLPVEQIYLRVFQPAARRLGEFWTDDLCSFVDVTLAMALMQSALRRLSPSFQRHGRAGDGRRSVLLATLPDDQHTFGLAMTAEFFRRSGWTVRCLSAGDLAEVAGQVGRECRPVVGFSVSRVDQLSELADSIRHLRRAGKDRFAGFLVGGPLLASRPDCAADAGADAVGLDARQALAEAERLAVAAGGDW
jgi:MerR family transcriptional regulator, light-induced transcriptional regulator